VSLLIYTTNTTYTQNTIITLLKHLTYGGPECHIMSIHIYNLVWLKKLGFSIRHFSS